MNDKLFRTIERIIKRHTGFPVVISLRQVSVDDIIELVCEFTNQDPKEIKGQSRKREIAEARQVICYLSRKYTPCSLGEIGVFLGDRDHTTVLHSCEKISDLLSIKDDRIVDIIERLNKILDERVIPIGAAV